MDERIPSPVGGNGRRDVCAVKLEDDRIRIHLSGAVSKSDINGTVRCDGASNGREGVYVGGWIGHGDYAQVVHPVIVRRAASASADAKQARTHGAVAGRA